MAVSSSVLKEFILKVFSEEPGSAGDRSLYLDGLSSTALTALNSGKTLSASSGNGMSASYEVFFGHRPDKIIEMIDQARTPCAEGSVSDALALVKTVRRFGSNFNAINK